MPGTYPQSDSDTESTSSMDVNPNKHPPPSPAPGNSRPDETMNALSTKFQDSLHVSGAERDETGNNRSQHVSPQLKMFEQQHRPISGNLFARSNLLSEGTGVPASDFSFGFPAPRNPPVASESQIFGCKVEQSEQVKADTTDSNLFARTSRSYLKRVMLPRGHGPPPLFSKIPDMAPELPTDQVPDVVNGAQPSAKRQAPYYLQVPKEDDDYATSPTKRMFGHPKAPLFAPETTLDSDELKHDGRPASVTSEKLFGTPRINPGANQPTLSSIQSLVSLLNLDDEDDKSLHVKLLEGLFEFLPSFTAQVIENTELAVKQKKIWTECDGDIASLERTRSSCRAWAELSKISKELARLNVERDEPVRGIAKTQAMARTLQVRLITQLTDTLKTLLEHYRIRYDAGTYTKMDVDAKNELINKLRLDTINFEEELKAAKSSSKVANETVEQLQIQLQVDASKAANNARSVHASHRQRIDQLVADHKTDKKEALNTLKDQYTAQIEEAESKFRMYRKGNAQIESLKTSVARLEREKADVLLAKAAREKELEDLETQAAQWKTFEDAYRQVKVELDQQTGEFNGVVAERNDLRTANEALRNAPGAQNTSVRSTETSRPMKGVGALKSCDQDLALLETYWRRQQRFAEMAKREMQAQVNEVDQDIEDIERELAALDAPEEGDPEPEAEIADVGVKEDPVSAESSAPQVATAISQTPNYWSLYRALY